MKQKTFSCGIAAEDLLAELDALWESAPICDDGKTMLEWSIQFGIGNHRMSKLLRAGLDAGRVVTGRAYRTRIDGRAVLTTVFRFAKKAKSAAKRKRR